MLDDTVTAPAIPLKTLISCLAQSYFNPQAALLLQCDEGFQDLQFRFNQIDDVHYFAISQLNIAISIGTLIRTFDCDRNRVT
jgi:hypothetical protein